VNKDEGPVIRRPDKKAKVLRGSANGILADANDRVLG